MKTKQLLIFSPAFNVADLIPETLAAFADLETVLAQYGCGLRVFIINDNSTDQTQEVLEKFRKSHPFLEIQKNEKNEGNAANIVLGYQWALHPVDEESLIGCCDADGEHNPLAFRRHIDYIDSDERDGVVGSIIYPADKLNWADLNMMRFLGSVQATMMGITDPFYIQSPGHQLHRPKFLRTAIEVLLSQYRTFFEDRYGEFPRWGMHGVIDSLVSLAGGKLKSVYLECFGLPPNRDDAKREAQALAALNHQQALRAFAEKQSLGK